MTDIHGLLTDEDAVSPVIGIVLMVAVTVILSAAVGAFVLDIGSAVTEKNPNAVLEFERTDNPGSDDTLTVRHGGGENLDSAELTVTIEGSTAWQDGTVSPDYTRVSSEWDDGVTSGDELILEEDGGSIDPGSQVQIIWQDGRRSSILGTGTLN